MRTIGYRPVAIALVFVALVSAQSGCDNVRSSSPLADADDGFIDPYVLGCWAEISEGPNGGIEPGEAALLVEPTAAHQLRVVSRDLNVDLVGHSFLLHGHKYFSGKSTEPEALFPYRVFHYATYVPGNWDIDRDTQRELDSLRGQLIFVSSMSRTYVEEAIEGGLIDGDVGCKGCDGDFARIAADTDALKSFVVTHNKAVFLSGIETWAGFMRDSEYDPFAVGGSDTCLDQDTSTGRIIDLSDSEVD